MCGVRPPGRVSGKWFAATTVVVGSGLPTAPLEALDGCHLCRPQRFARNSNLVVGKLVAAINPKALAQ